MEKKQIAAQLYTIRDHLATASEFVRSMARVREMGYETVQLSGEGDVSDAELRKIFGDAGLVCCATHESGTDIIESPEKVADRLEALDCSMTAFPHPGEYPVATMADVEALASGLDRAGAVLRSRGQVLGYHNHAVEFINVEGKTILEWIYEKTSPENLVSEIDTYWVQAGGGDPLQWVRAMKGRQPFIHLKDFGPDEANKAGSAFKEIGSGNLDWKQIIPAAEAGGCRWFIVEQDGNWANDDPFLSLKISFDYLASTFCA